MTSRSKSIAALCLIVPAPTLGLVLNDVLAPYGASGWPLGSLAFGFAKFWLCALPIAWLLWVDRSNPSLSPVRKGGWMMAIVTGMIAAGLIVGGYLLIGRFAIDPQQVRNTIEKFNLQNQSVYLAAAGYWILINSVLEEYVFRWFIVSKCEMLMPTFAAIIVSASAFVVHHTVAMANFFPWWINLIASLAIFVAAACWSWLYVRYRSVWIPYLSHAIADVAIFALGWWIVFGESVT